MLKLRNLKVAITQLAMDLQLTYRPEGDNKCRIFKELQNVTYTPFFLM